MNYKLSLSDALDGKKRIWATLSAKERLFEGVISSDKLLKVLAIVEGGKVHKIELWTEIFGYEIRGDLKVELLDKIQDLLEDI
jgi:hypothetical protein